MTRIVPFILALLIACVASAAEVRLNPGDNANAKLGALAANDTVIVGEGTFNVSSMITPPSGVTFKGVRGKSWFHTLYDRQMAFRLADGRTLTFIDIGFDGGAIEGQGSSTLILDWCRFTKFDRGPNSAFGGGLAVGSGGHGGGWLPKNSRVTNCSFYDAQDGWAMGWYSADGITITDNEFININNGLKADNGSDTGHRYARNNVVARNYFERIGRMAIEFQGGCEGFVLEDNDYALPRMKPGDWRQNADVFAFSVIFNGQKNRNCIARRNKIVGLPLVRKDNNQISQTRVDGGGSRVGIECGNDFIVEDNLISGMWSSYQCWMGETTARPPTPINQDLIGPTYVRNNRIIDQGGGGSFAHGPNTKKFFAGNNGPNVHLEWLNRPRPGPGRSGGGTPTTIPIPDPTPKVITSAKAGPDAGTIELVTTSGGTLNIVSTGDGVNRGSVAIPGAGTHVIESIAGWDLRLSIGSESATVKTTGTAPPYNPSPQGYPAPKLRSGTPAPAKIEFEAGVRVIPGTSIRFNAGRYEYDPATKTVKVIRAAAVE